MTVGSSRPALREDRAALPTYLRLPQPELLVSLHPVLVDLQHRLVLRLSDALHFSCKGTAARRQRPFVFIGVAFAAGAATDRARSASVSRAASLAQQTPPKPDTENPFRAPHPPQRASSGRGHNPVLSHLHVSITYLPPGPPQSQPENRLSLSLAGRDGIRSDFRSRWAARSRWALTTGPHLALAALQTHKRAPRPPSNRLTAFPSALLAFFSGHFLTRECLIKPHSTSKSMFFLESLCPSGT